MRIVIITGIFPPDVGGPATYVPVVAQGLQNLGHQVTVITSSEPQHLTWDDAGYKFPVVRLNRRLSWALRTFYYQKQLAQYVGQCDVVYGHGLWWEVAQVCQKFNRPWVAKIVGDSTWERAVRRGWTKANLDEFQCPSFDIRIKLFRYWHNQAINQAKHVIVPSNYLAEIIKKWGVNSNQIKVIYNAITLPGNISKLHNPLNTPYRVMTAGRLVPWKQIDEIITAITPLTDVGLLIVGNGSERQKLEQQVQDLCLENRVYFTGQKTQLELLALMQTCDVFILNSTYEGLPHIVLEAMSIGIPVVATAVGGTPEIIKDGITGRLIPPHAPDILQLVIGELLQQPELGQHYTRNAQELLTHFRTQTMIDQCAEVLHQVVGK
ncbi:glycosyltransferase [Gloeomargarita lithophora Alchichica-D10]|uniref:Glycosyltransferase n=1 Tax=Gloeomargarita lithophora Alchichica-D10 TaxID=1188229 RepID=A0A1J0AAE6_9CYAN|nr:glycosyltransferase family 4 protein [Gloeomargarita lithophora]APB32908.1 glycosyltransferase [Gloeomargarita lithophora Alchichica-D10]